VTDTGPAGRVITAPVVGSWNGEGQVDEGKEEKEGLKCINN
jgi:hypothetical protein